MTTETKTDAWEHQAYGRRPDATIGPMTQDEYEQVQDYTPSQMAQMKAMNKARIYPATFGLTSDDRAMIETIEAVITDGTQTKDFFEDIAGISVNPSGIHPTENKVLVLPKPVEEKFAGSSLLKPVDLQTKEEFATTQGRIIACSPLAFNYASPEEWEASGGTPPKPGQTVVYAKYAGLRVKGKDGQDYLLLNDKDLAAVFED